MVTILVSVLLSALVTVALLLVTRARLAAQFRRVERRLNQLERSFIALRQARERENTTEQLQRLHRGLVRLHESIAERFGPLAEIVPDLRRRIVSPWRLRDSQICGLERWAENLGLPSGELAAVIDQLETHAPTGPLGFTPADGVALALVLRAHPAAVSPVLFVAEAAPDWTSSVREVASAAAPHLVLSGHPRAEEADIVICSRPAATSLERSLKAGASLVTLPPLDPDSAAPAPLSLPLLAAGWSLEVYRQDASTFLNPQR